MKELKIKRYVPELYNSGKLYNVLGYNNIDDMLINLAPQTEKEFSIFDLTDKEQYFILLEYLTNDKLNTVLSSIFLALNLKNENYHTLEVLNEFMKESSDDFYRYLLFLAWDSYTKEYNLERYSE